MNVFEKDAEEKRNRKSDGVIVSAWVSFRAAIKEFIEFYNSSHPDGELYPAEIIQETAYGLVIDSNRGGHPKVDFAALVISVSASLKREKFLIHCEVEHWCKKSGGATPHRDSQKIFNFVLSGEGNSLQLDEEVLTPKGAAERLLSQALLGK